MGRWQSTQERSQGFWPCLSYPTISFKAYDMIPTSFAWLYEDLWHHRWLQLDERTFWKPRCWLFAPLPSKVVFWARQSCLDLTHETFKQKSHVLLIEHLSKLSNIFEHIVTYSHKIRRKGHGESQETKTSGAVFFFSWYQMIRYRRSLRSRSLGVLGPNFTFRSRSPSNISFEPLALLGHPGNFQWSLVTFSSLASVVQLKKNTHIGIAIYISYRIRLQQQCI